MKRLMFVFILLPILLQAQSWYPIGATWYINNQYMEMFPAHGYSKYTVIKDTIVGSLPSKLVKQESIKYNGDTLFVYYHIVREDSSKVYYYTNNVFQLMYDFTLSVGDTLAINTMGFGCDSVSPLIVDSIDMININGIDLRIQYVSGTYYIDSTFGGQTETITYPVIERIGFNNLCSAGDVQFFFNPLCEIEDQFIFNWFRCYNDSNISYTGCYWAAHYTGLSCDALIDGSGIDESGNTGNNLFDIFPNPATNSLHFASHSPVYRTEIMLYDLRGQLLLKQTLINEKTELDISALAKGMYIVKFENEKGIEVKRVIKE